MGGFLSKNEFPVAGRTVVITGGSSGMGLAVARQLAERGANVVIVARDQDKLQRVLEDIRHAAREPRTQRFHQLSADVSDPAESARVIDEVVAWNAGSPPDIVWCCAGSSRPSLMVDAPPSQLKSEMDSNYFTAAYMAHATLTCWVKKARENKTGAEGSGSPTAKAPPRHLIFTASFLSFYSFAGYTAYSASKAALRSLSDSLSQEVNLYAASYPAEPLIRCHTVFPAAILTEGFAIETLHKPDITKMLEESDEGQTPELVASKSIEALEAGQELITTDILTALVRRSMLGGSIRGGFWRAMGDWLLASLMGLVMIIVRSDMDRKVRKWGRDFGSSGMKTDTKALTKQS